MNEIIAIISGCLALVALYRIIFNDKEEFIECIKFWFTPDIFSLFQGNFWEDYKSEFKLGLWLGCGSMVGYGVYALIQ